jgi:MFS family permease
MQNNNFKLFWLGRMFSGIAYQMTAVAVGWQIYAITGKVIYLGFVGLAQFLPMFLLTLPVGHVADRYNRRLIISISQIAQAAGVFFLAAGSHGNWLTKISILVVVALFGAAHSFDGPTMNAFMPGLVDENEFPRAAAVAASAMQTSFIIGPALGGLLYAFGPVVVYISAGALLAAASMMIFFIRHVHRAPGHETADIKSVFAGISFIKSRPVILGAISLDLFAVLLGGATALLPVFARDILKTGPWGLGLLRSSPAVGALLMSFFLSVNPLKNGVGKKMFTAVVIFGAGTIVFAVSKNFWLSAAALVVLGGADVISVVIRQALVQMKTPDNMRGRVSAVSSMFVGTSNQLGEFESGLTASWFGTVPAAMIGGTGTIIVVFLWMKFFPALLHADKIEKES